MTNQNKSYNSTANLGFEQKLWLAADKLRGTMDAADYKHTVLGLIFLKYISDSFETHQSLLTRETANPDSESYIPDEAQRNSVIEDRDEYLSENVFWVPPEARWTAIQNNAKHPTIGKIIDDAMDLIERENQRIKGILPKNYTRPDLDKIRLGELIDLIGTISVGTEEGKSQDILGRVYEYFLAKFASAEGKGGGEFYTPSSVVKVLVEMIEPFKGRVYDPCCGSGGMFVQSEKFVEAHGGSRNDISVFGQESNPTTWRLAQMNLAIRGIEANLGGQWGDSFHNDLHPDLKADYILANPPFNVSDWGGDRLREDKRWVHGVPPVSNANFAWVLHIIHHLAPNGIAGFVLANGSMSSNTAGAGKIRKAIIEADLVDCMLMMPGQLFYSTQISVCLWILARNKGKSGILRDRRRETLFIDARKLGYLIDRKHRQLSDEDISRISQTYHAWRGEKWEQEYEDIRGFCFAATKKDISQHRYALVPGRFVGAELPISDDEPFAEKMEFLIESLKEEIKMSRKVEEQILNQMDKLKP